MAAKQIQYPNINNSQAQNCAASYSNRPTGQKPTIYLPIYPSV